ncbi:hypothetical protein [Streptomyces niveus]|uniref:hypothetical protein n=1 Tax=Streptomyces niveus TaxID=193462 RepID=UPI00342D5B72
MTKLTSWPVFQAACRSTDWPLAVCEPPNPAVRRRPNASTARAQARRTWDWLKYFSQVGTAAATSSGSPGRPAFSKMSWR